MQVELTYGRFDINATLYVELDSSPGSCASSFADLFSKYRQMEGVPKLKNPRGISGSGCRTVCPNNGFLLGAGDLGGNNPFPLRRYAEFINFTQGSDPDHATQYLPFKSIVPLYAILRFG